MSVTVLHIARPVICSICIDVRESGVSACVSEGQGAYVRVCVCVRAQVCISEFLYYCTPIGEGCTHIGEGCKSYSRWFYTIQYDTVLVILPCIFSNNAR